jgi:two-component system, sensor histidine kinase and response regulator
MNGTEHQSDILIVDDTIANLKLLAEMLRTEGFGVRPVSSGAQALRTASRRSPDLILLDITMPEMDGYEVCRRLKADPSLADIPVIFISALSELDDKVKAFSSGGVDYVTKPFQLDEVRARVETHLRLRRLQQQLEGRNAELAATNSALEQMQELRDELLHLIVHDLRAPLSGMILSLGMLQEDLNDLIDDDTREDLAGVYEGARLLSSMVTDLLDMNRMEAGDLPLELESHSAKALVELAIRSLGGLVHNRQLTVVADAELRLVCDASVVRRILSNLLDNALKHTLRRVPVEVSVRANGDLLRFSVKDEGQGIPAEFLGLVFERFGQVKARRTGGRSSTGLGLAFCKLATQAHGGDISVDSTVGEGTTFWFDLPIDGPPAS